MFGRKLFETFAAEFMGSHLAEGTHISKLSKELSDVKSQLDESHNEIKDRESKIVLAESKVTKINESRERETVMSELMSPLSKDKRELMVNLLESVSTSKLKVQFNKYLPTVLNESTTTVKSQKLNESQKTEITGNKAATIQATESEAEIINLKKLAGIN
jgi:septal ring factor EnvC (AmiA/AmiB activator)